MGYSGSLGAIQTVHIPAPTLPTASRRGVMTLLLLGKPVGTMPANPRMHFAGGRHTHHIETGGNRTHQWVGGLAHSKGRLVYTLGCDNPDCLGSQDSDAGVARAWRGRGADYRHFFLGLGGAGVARAWRGHVL
eukprot:gene9124-biopygen1645